MIVLAQGAPTMPKPPMWLGYFTKLAIALLVLMVVLGVALNVWQVMSRKHTWGMTVGIVGRKGAGKSYMAVRIAIDRLRRGVDVYSNFRIDTDALGLKGTWRAFQGWEQFAEIRNAVVIVDEAHLYAPSHQHLRFPMLARMALAHSRKTKIDLYWISQHEDRVNRTLRDLTDLMMYTEAYFGHAFFLVKAYEPETFRKPKKHLYRRIYRFDKKIAGAYDTAELIEVDDHALIGDSSAAAVRRLQATRAPGARNERPARPVDVGDDREEYVG